MTKATNVRLEGNLAHQFMTGHAPVTELRNSIIIAQAGTQPINVTNAQATVLSMDHVQISSPAGQRNLNVVKSKIDGRRLTVLGPEWENAGTIHLTESVIGGSKVTDLPGGTWSGEKNVYAINFGPEAQNSDCVHRADPDPNDRLRLERFAERQSPGESDLAQRRLLRDRWRLGGRHRPLAALEPGLQRRPHVLTRPRRPRQQRRARRSDQQRATRVANGHLYLQHEPFVGGGGHTDARPTSSLAQPAPRTRLRAPRPSTPARTTSP